MIVSASLYSFCHDWLLSLRSLLFSNERKGSRGEGSRKQVEGEEIIEIDHLRKESIFNMPVVETEELAAQIPLFTRAPESFQSETFPARYKTHRESMSLVKQ